MNKNYTFNIAVCEGRHDIPEATNGSIFPSTIPEDVVLCQDLAQVKMRNLSSS